MKRLFTYMLFGALFFALAAETGCTKETLDHYKNEGFVDIELAWPEGGGPHRDPRPGQHRGGGF